MRIVNYNHYGSTEALDKAFGDKWYYIGRGNNKYGLKPSPLLNPYRIGINGDRDNVISLFRDYLWSLIVNEPQMIVPEIKSLDPDTVLVCYCKPENCHGDVIIKAHKWLTSTS